MTKLRKTKLSLLLGLVGCATTVYATDNDINVLINADIITMNPDKPSAQAIAYADGKILAIGSTQHVQSIAGKDANIVDLKGKTVIPGLIETHDHIFLSSATAVITDVAPFTTPKLSDALVKIGETKVNEEGWVIAFGADQTLYEEKRGPHITELDALFPNDPVAIFHLSGHGAYVNSKALELAGIDESTADPQGGFFEKDENGKLTGFLSGQPAIFMVTNYPAADAYTTTVAAKQRAAAGITTASDFSVMNEPILELLSDVTAQEGFSTRIVGGLFSTAPNFDELARSVPDYENELFKVPFVKTWTDGSIQGGTGNLTQGYYDEAFGESGAQGTQEYYNQQMLDIYALGMWPAFHTNGDGATDMALNAIEFAQNETKNTDIRPQLIHVQYTRPEQITRMSELNTQPTFFTTHIYYWGDLHYESTLGAERAQRLSAMKDAVDAGLKPAMHNDKPVSDIDPFLNIELAVTRTSSSGRVLGADQAITPYQALEAYTTHAAYQFGMEDVAGSLEVGKYADFVVIDANPLSVEPTSIRNIQVQGTVMNGNVTYSGLDELDTLNSQ
ncbi:metal-dependent hydrolase [Vibrio ishigakensis]|uniref:Metal-dependent hydrolase n=1 Tax=Vibrio ishigakensis TaxID=1481914 RepID=A0A0B8QLP5_9VIBR|nr:metal-dependent hydrolase [Vibrio ishigakensis]